MAIPENIKNLNSSDGKISYSTDEQIIGTWIDGKPLYQRTVSVSGSSLKGTDYTIANLASWGIKTIVNVFGNASGTINNGWNPLSHAYPTTSWAKTCYISGGAIKICTGSNQSFANPVFTIQYTKTTD